jgi:hypothetical protein
MLCAAKVEDGDKVPHSIRPRLSLIFPASLPVLTDCLFFLLHPHVFSFEREIYFLSIYSIHPTSAAPYIDPSARMISIILPFFLSYGSLTPSVHSPALSPFPCLFASNSDDLNSMVTMQAPLLMALR